MKKAIEDIKRDVRIIVDENDTVDHLLMEAESDPDALMTDEIAEAMVLRAIDKVHKLAPLTMVADISAALTMVPSTKLDHGHRVELPGNWLRLVSVYVNGWGKTVTDAVDESSNEYLMQMSDFAGIRATLRKPVVAIMPNALGTGLVMEMFPQGTTGTSARLSGVTDSQGGVSVDENGNNAVGQSAFKIRYIKMASADADLRTEIADKCYDAALYMIANMYLQSIGETEKAKVMAMECAELLGIATNAEQ